MLSRLSALFVVDYRCGRFLHPLDRLSGLGDTASRVVAIATTVVSSNCKVTPARPSIAASTTVLTLATVVTLTTAIVLATPPLPTALALALTATTIEAESSLEGPLRRGFSVTHDGMILRVILLLLLGLLLLRLLLRLLLLPRLLLLAAVVAIATGITRGSSTLSFFSLPVEATGRIVTKRKRCLGPDALVATVGGHFDRC
jgi:hypothetical protein